MIRYIMILILGFFISQCQKEQNNEEIVTYEELEKFLSDNNKTITNIRITDEGKLIVEHDFKQNIPTLLPISLNENIIDYIKFDDIQYNPQKKKWIGLVYEPHWYKKEHLYMYYGFKKLLQNNNEKNFILFDEGIVASKEKKEVSVSSLYGASEIDLLDALQNNYVDVPAILKFRNEKKVKLYGTEDEIALKESAKLFKNKHQSYNNSSNSIPSIDIELRIEEHLEHEFNAKNKKDLSEKDKIRKEIQSGDIPVVKENELLKKIINLNIEIIENSKEDKFSRLIRDLEKENLDSELKVEFNEKNKKKLSEKYKIRKEIRSEDLTVKKKTELLKKIINLNKEIIENSKEDNFYSVIIDLKKENHQLEMNIKISSQTLVRDETILKTINEISKEDKEDSVLFVFIGNGHYLNLKDKLRTTFNTYRVKVTIEEKFNNNDYVEYNKAVINPKYIRTEHKISDRWNIPEISRKIVKNNKPNDNYFFKKIERIFKNGNNTGNPTIRTMESKNNPILSFTLDHNFNISGFSIQTGSNSEEMLELTDIVSVHKEKILNSQYTVEGGFRFYTTNTSNEKIITVYRKQNGVSNEEPLNLIKGIFNQGNTKNPPVLIKKQRDKSVENLRTILKAA